MTFGGSSFPCDTTVVTMGARQLPLLCDAGRYVQVSNHPGALNEGFSDVFGDIQPSRSIGRRWAHVSGGSKLGEHFTDLVPLGSRSTGSCSSNPSLAPSRTGII